MKRKTKYSFGTNKIEKRNESNLKIKKNPLNDK